ncbi:MAG: GH92 family glycosyl hydrolase [Bacteroidales bacterium]|nr:GH92 family glycosyl hydrolase [Bacteroidales bacterium]
MKVAIFCSIVCFFILSCTNNQSFYYINYVNPFIGTDGNGHTFPGATVPFGLVQLSPDTRLEGWEGCSGYHYSDSVIYGFSHTHLSGTGVSDLGDILLMPTIGTVKVLSGNAENNWDGYASNFSHKNEIALPGYYSVDLLKYNIKVELTTTERVGIHKYHYPKNITQNVIIDLVHRDKVIDSYLKFVSDNEIEGYRFSSAWATNQKLFFVIQFSKPIISKGIVVDDSKFQNSDVAKGNNVKAFVNFSGSSDSTLMVKVALSYVSIEGARKNLKQEASCWNFGKYVKSAKRKWERILSKIKIQASDSIKKVFYTSLYHAYIHPNIFNDVDKQYRGRNDSIYTLEKGNYYTIFSLWDTYRAWHPLMTILEPEACRDFIRTFLLQYKHSKLLPIWELTANETNCMIGYHAVSVIYDAWQKGIKGYDPYMAMNAMITMATRNIPSLKNYEKYGAVVADDDGESVSKTLEYAYDDWCIAQMAKSLGLYDVSDRFFTRAKYYQNLFDPNTKFFRARKNGAWVSPFSPYDVTFHYTEANAWQYRFYVPHDIIGLIRLFGGMQNFEHALDSLFNTHSNLYGRFQPDITGLIGQYAHGNEPSHHLAYLYNFIGKPYKTQELIPKICSFYTTKPDGLIGNEDCGQMSAWYIFSALGFYPVTPGDSVYIIGIPQVEEATLQLSKPFKIITHRKGKSNQYIQSVKFNGKEWKYSYLPHRIIMQGGTLEFFLNDKPSNWATDTSYCPKTITQSKEFLPTPYYQEGLRVFKKKQNVTLKSIDTLASVLYSFDSVKWYSYIDPITVDSTTVIYSYATKHRQLKSALCKIEINKLDDKKSIKIFSQYNRQYSGGGDIALIDGVYGKTDFRTGEWQGYQDTDLVAIIDLGEIRKINYLGAHFLQDVSPWILFPPYVEFSVSKNGKQFTSIATIKNKFRIDDWKPQTAFFDTNISPQWARYIKVFVKRSGNLPHWHPGAGYPAFFFIDEIVIK